MIIQISQSIQLCKRQKKKKCTQWKFHTNKSAFLFPSLDWLQYTVSSVTHEAYNSLSTEDTLKRKEEEGVEAEDEKEGEKDGDGGRSLKKKEKKKEKVIVKKKKKRGEGDKERCRGKRKKGRESSP